MKTTTLTPTSPERLDTFLSTALGESRHQVAQLIKASAVSVDGVIATKPGLKLKADQSVSITFPQTVTTEALPVDFDVEVLYEDDDVMVINKPSGVTVHPAPSVKEATLVDWLKLQGIQLSTISGEERHGIVHRLDKGTSGAMVIAKNNHAHEALSEQLQAKTMGRYYLAVISPILKENIIIEKPIGRNRTNRLKMAHISDGRDAKTAFTKLALSKTEKAELIACKLFTGRTHQIRVHLETMSRHILGDTLYGVKSGDSKISRILLHAYIIYFVHPTRHELMQFTAPIPDEMRGYLDDLFDKETLHEHLDPDSIKHRFSAEFF